MAMTSTANSRRAAGSVGGTGSVLAPEARRASSKTRLATVPGPAITTWTASGTRPAARPARYDGIARHRPASSGAMDTTTATAMSILKVIASAASAPAAA